MDETFPSADRFCDDCSQAINMSGMNIRPCSSCRECRQVRCFSCTLTSQSTFFCVACGFPNCNWCVKTCLKSAVFCQSCMECKGSLKAHAGRKEFVRCLNCFESQCLVCSKQIGVYLQAEAESSSVALLLRNRIRRCLYNARPWAK